FLIAHTFGRRMLYPGSVGLLQKAMRPMLQQGQAKLIEEHDGQRNKLVACDGNEIDTMFVDRRKDGGPKGQTLVICCEGNAGFYEVGCMNTPLEVPFPQNEANAMDVVIQFAVHKLGFQLSDIVIYAWSIGGFTGPLVQHTVRQYMNLNNAEQLLKDRSCWSGGLEMKSSLQPSVYSGYEVDDDWCVSVLQSYQTDRDVSFPWSVGKLPHSLEAISSTQN
ncbi:hypothetical protein XENOCAPTIV_029957, partial [Xenoophorus captivus]